jgi:putative endonuclease
VIDYCYVYILVSEKDPSRHYTGLTHSIEERLEKHNTGGVRHTAKYRPWRLEVAVMFRGRARAAEFERYLKSGSGRAFARRHL